ncbi:TPA: hypothetical protein HA241_03675 [Candidatus Woesearchaeota archaeon]|nr:hypothetical protein [Candidatus Woesearchaeota archaeon]
MRTTYHRHLIEIKPIENKERFTTAVMNSLVADGAIIVVEPTEIASGGIVGSYILGNVAIGYYIRNTPDSSTAEATLSLRSQGPLEGALDVIQRLYRPIINGGPAKTRSLSLEDEIVGQ